MKDFEKHIATMIEDYRSQAFDAVDETMFEAFCDIYNSIMEQPDCTFTGSIAGLSKEVLNTLKDIQSERGLLEEISGPRKARYTLAFLNYDQRVRDAFVSRYPSAYLKWTEKEEDELRDMISRSFSWTSISEKLHRNVNAIKIRAEKLGLVADTGAKKRF